MKKKYRLHYTINVNWINISHSVKQSNLIRSKIQNRTDPCRISRVFLINSSYSRLKVFIFTYIWYISLKITVINIISSIIDGYIILYR